MFFQLVIVLACEPLETVRIAVMGSDMRGEEAVRRLSFLEGVQINALLSFLMEAKEQLQAVAESRFCKKYVIFVE